VPFFEDFIEKYQFEFFLAIENIFVCKLSNNSGFIAIQSIIEVKTFTKAKKQHKLGFFFKKFIKRIPFKKSYYFKSLILCVDVLMLK